MIIIISPAKTLDFSEETRFSDQYTLPMMLDESGKLVHKLAKMRAKKIGELMHVSEKIAALNYDRFQQYSTPFTPENAKQALMAFKGDVYLGFDLPNYQEADFEFAQNHLRILSGLYGLLKPLDLIQPYRLEMGTPLTTRRGKNLYAFWGDRIAKALNGALEAVASDTLVNLASIEYFKSVRQDKFKGKIITPIFKEERNGQLKNIAIFSKKARGLMSNFAIQNRITDPEGLKAFDLEGYRYMEALSSESEWVFGR